MLTYKTIPKTPGAVAAAAALAGATCLACIPLTAYAWNADGHRQIADIAWTRLTPAVRARVTKILFGADPASGRRPTDTSDEAVRLAFRIAATFPDDIKRDQDFGYGPLIDSENQAFPVDLPAGSSEAVRCKTWHYYDTAIRLPAGMPPPPIDRSNALVALNRAEGKLRSLSASGRDVRLQFWYLTWVEHLVGDVHQPLHCVSSYEFSPTGDAGGNLFPLAPDEDGRRQELHFLWDDGITRAAHYTGRHEDAAGGYEAVTAKWETDPTLQPAVAQVKDLSVQDWIADGANLANTRVYTGIARGDSPSPAYLSGVESLSKQQTVLAGYRLAAVLNNVLGS